MVDENILICYNNVIVWNSYSYVRGEADESSWN